MIYLALALSFLGITLLIIDICIEGFGVIGVVGVLVFIASLFLNILFVEHGALVILIKLAIYIPAALLFLRLLKRKRFHDKIVLNETLVEEEEDTSTLADFINLEGVTTTALRPFGRANINGSNIEVWSEIDFISASKPVKVIKQQGRKLFVKEIVD